MYSFELTSEQLEIKNLALKFAKNEMMPNARKYDEKEELPLDILRKAWELGLVNTCIPTNFGGNGFSSLDAMLITESLAYGCLGMNTAIMANDLALLPIVIGANEDQKKRFLTPFTFDYKIAAFCLTEPENGSDAGGLKTQLKKCGDDFELTGNKMRITNAGVADLFVVYATVDNNLKHKGITACVVEKGATGLEIGGPEHKMGHRCSDTRAVTFNKVKVPKENIIGDVGGGWKIAMKTLNHSRPMVAASALGGAQAAYEHSVQYAKERKQFGKTLSEHQAIQFMIADMAMKIEAARLLVYQSAWLLDNRKENAREASFAKAFATDICMQIATDAVQVFGGYGYSREYPVEKIMRDAKLMQIYEGTAQIQRMVIAKDIFTRS